MLVCKVCASSGSRLTVGFRTTEPGVTPSLQGVGWVGVTHSWGVCGAAGQEGTVWLLCVTSALGTAADDWVWSDPCVPVSSAALEPHRNHSYLHLDSIRMGASF